MFGAHPDPRLALRRALREMSQSLVVVSQDSGGETLYTTHNRETARWLQTATRRSEQRQLRRSA